MLSRSSKAPLLRSLTRNTQRNFAVRASASALSTRSSATRPVPRSPILSPIHARPMSSVHAAESTLRPEPDKVLQDIADYVHSFKIDPTGLAMRTASLCLIDTIGCGLEGLRFPECTKLLGPVVEGTVVPNGTSRQYHSSKSLLNTIPHRYKGTRHQLPARSYPWRLQHWNHHPLARFQ